MKRILSIILSFSVICMMFPSISVMAVSPIITAEIVSAAVGETAEVKITISDNPGVIALGLDINYNRDHLHLLEVRNGEIFDDSCMTAGNDNTLVPYTIIWDDATAENIMANGTVATLCFEVLPEATSVEEIGISIMESSTVNSALKKVTFSASNGAILIQKSGILKASDIKATCGQEVKVPLIISNNPGIIGLRLSVDYDPNLLSLISVEDAKLFPEATSTFGNDLRAHPYYISWDDYGNENNYQNGIIAYMVFKITDNASVGATNITVSIDPNSTINSSLKKAEITGESGKVFINNEQEISIDRTSAKPGEYIDVPIQLTNNSGVSALGLNIQFDTEQLILKSIENGTVFSNATVSYGKDTNISPYTILWENNSTMNTKENGVLAIMHFYVLENAIEGISPITADLISGSTIDEELNRVMFNIINGEVKIESTLSTTTTTTTTTTTSTITSTLTSSTTSTASKSTTTSTNSTITATTTNTSSTSVITTSLATTSTASSTSSTTSTTTKDPSTSSTTSTTVTTTRGTSTSSTTSTTTITLKTTSTITNTNSTISTTSISSTKIDTSTSTTTSTILSTTNTTSTTSTSIITYPTAKIRIDKRDTLDQQVAGAELKLTGVDKNGNPITFKEGCIKAGEDVVLETVSGTELKWRSGSVPVTITLADGIYTLHEMSAPTGYEAAANMIITITDGKLVRVNEAEPISDDVIMIDKTVTQTTTIRTSSTTSTTSTTTRGTSTSSTTSTTLTTTRCTSTSSTTSTTSTTTRGTSTSSTTSTTSTTTRGTSTSSTTSTTSTTSTSSTNTETSTSTTTSTTSSTTSTTTITPPPSVMYGDVDCNGKVDMDDVTALNKWLNNPASVEITEQGKVNGDVYNTGDGLTTEDAETIMAFYNGMIPGIVKKCAVREYPKSWIGRSQAA